MPREIEIIWNCQGYVKIVVELKDDCKQTIKEIAEKLNKGILAPTIQENGSLDIVANGESIGTNVFVDNNLEYAAFDVEEHNIQSFKSAEETLKSLKEK